MNPESEENFRGSCLYARLEDISTLSYLLFLPTF